ncbi:MAG: Rrf2 family transcriptional regulator [Candidatus Omnitrophica bacterium]|nr:Rrf2 family transcriptional regulator [Candidatus Omnitrophota bacterium]
MRFTTKTEYGLVCMIYLARHAEAEWVSIKEIAGKERYSVPFTEKILQSLRKAGLVASHQGNHGGYVLARKPSEITLKQIIEALEGGTFDVFCKPEVREDIVCTHFCLCGVKPIWRKTKAILDEFYDSVTLDMLTHNEIEVKSLMGAGHEQ